jgi:ABC-type nitrate/sulfonate/bicarbonate transport system permease component
VNRGKRLHVDLRAAVVPLALVFSAQVLGKFDVIGSDNLATPSEIGIALTAALRDGELLRATLQTLAMTGAGLLIGGLFGTLVGAACGISRITDRLAQFPIEALRPIPSLALLPIALLIYGFGYGMEIAVVAFSAIWPMLILTRAAVLRIEPRLMEVARLLDLNALQIGGKLLLPAMLPQLFVALRLSVGISLIVAVTVEITANPLGLGYGMLNAQQSLHPALALAFLVWIGVLGWAINGLLELVQRQLFAEKRQGPA